MERVPCLLEACDSRDRLHVPSQMATDQLIIPSMANASIVRASSHEPQVSSSSKDFSLFVDGDWFFDESFILGRHILR